MKFLDRLSLQRCIQCLLLFIICNSFAQGTRLLRQPDISQNQITFTYGGDIWVVDINHSKALRITSTAAVEANPRFSPDGKWIAFNSNRSGNQAVYIASADGGAVKRITWHPGAAEVRGWTLDGKHILYATNRETAPSNYNRLWTIPVAGGPAKMLTSQWGHDGSFSPDGKKMIIDKMRRWDVEWRAYRGGQNTPLIILNLSDNSEKLLPNNKTVDIKPVWLGDKIYFLSDRDGISNIWSYNPADEGLVQLTKFKGSPVKWLSGNDSQLVFEREGYLHLYDLGSGATKDLAIDVVGDFPWAETKWESVSNSARSVSLSATGKRAIMEARGEIFTIPTEHGDARNITDNTAAADRAPIWSPKGDQIAWFSDQGGKGYSLKLGNQDGLQKPRTISLGESKMAWQPTWSPDGKHIAFTDDDVRIRVIELSSGKIKTIDVGGTNLERTSLGLSWSPDSNWLAYAKSGSNNFRQITVWSKKENKVRPLTNSFANAFSPSWDLNGKHLYFLASTDLALGSGWANTSSMTARPVYAAYLINLQKSNLSPFVPRSDEEPKIKEDKKEEPKKASRKKSTKKEDKKEDNTKKSEAIKIDFDGIDRRIIPLPMPKRNYRMTVSGPKGAVFIGEAVPNSRGLTLHKFSIKDREAKEFANGASQISVSADSKKMLARLGPSWKLINTSGANAKGAKSVKVNLNIKLDRATEWKQMFEEAWRYERDYFYDPAMHGRDWKVVYNRYAPLIPFVKHRSDLNYVLDQLNGELSVGHSFVFGGDFPSVDRSMSGLLGADLVAENGHWKIKRIYTTESWNPELSSPLDRPGIKVAEGNYLVGINGKPLTSNDNPYQFLDGTLGKQTIININKLPKMDGNWTEIVKPIGSENRLRQRAWVEDNRRLVDKLSGGKLAYIWVPNTGSPGFVSFNRYFFAQQDKLGAVIDERFNGGGLLDDYMVDLMTRTLRAGLTNEVPNGKPMRLPAGILGPKVLLINELAGSGGDFFPWVFRQQKAGKLIGATTWGGLVKSSVHYGLVDGGALTAPDNAVFDPINNKWVAENEGVAPDIAVRQDAKSLSQGRDPQLERAVQEVLKLINANPVKEIIVPKFSTPTKPKK